MSLLGYISGKMWDCEIVNVNGWRGSMVMASLSLSYFFSSYSPAFCFPSFFSSSSSSFFFLHPCSPFSLPSCFSSSIPTSLPSYFLLPLLIIFFFVLFSTYNIYLFFSTYSSSSSTFF